MNHTAIGEFLMAQTGHRHFESNAGPLGSKPLEGEPNRSTYRAERLSKFFALIDKEIKLIEPISDGKLEGTAVAKSY